MLSRVAIAALVGTVLSAADARQIISKAVDAERENRRRMATYLFVEEIRRSAFDRSRNEISHNMSTYEVFFMEGRPAFRLTSLNGRPLTSEEERQETARLQQLAEDRKRDPHKRSPAEDRRRSHPLYRFLDLHDFRLAGSQQLDGRDCWVIESGPRRGAKGKTGEDGRIVHSTARFWIDRETFHRVRMDVTAEKATGPAQIRESTRYHWAQRDGSVWLITAIESVLPAAGRNGAVAYYQGEQRYSRYRRFLSESAVSDVEELDNAVPRK